MFDVDEDNSDGLLKYPEIEKAFIGPVERHGRAPVACYSKRDTLDIIQKNFRQTAVQAMETYEFSVLQLDHGEATPVFLDDI